jgi:hypothetical protein
VPDIPEPYVYLGIRVAADDQGYLDPLLFLPTRAAPPASSPSASDPPSEASGGEASAPPAAAEPPPTAAPAAPEPTADTGSATDSAPDGGEAISPAGEASEAGAGETSPETGDASDATPKAATPPAVSIPGGHQEVEDVDTATSSGGEPQAEDATSDGVEAEQDFSGGDATVAPATAQRPRETAAAPRSSLAIEHHAAPSGVEQSPRAHPLAATTPPPSHEVGDFQRPSAGSRRPDPAEAPVTGKARPPAVHDGSEDAAAIRTVSLRAAASTGAAAIAATLAVVVLLRRCRRRPDATPSGAEAPPEAPRMMLLVGGSEHAADPRGVDRQPRRADPEAAALDRHERLAA